MADNKYALAFSDGLPRSRWPHLVVPRKHVASIYELDIHEQRLSGNWSASLQRDK
jgi:hypothetical protein